MKKCKNILQFKPDKTNILCVLRGENMWITKVFKTLQQQNEWIEKNKHKYQIDILFVNNEYVIEYKKLKRILS